MCEKIRERKVLSLSSDDENDTIPSDWEEVKPKKKRRRRSKKNKYCNTCDQNITDLKKRDQLRFKNTYHQMLAKNYCKEHETSYSNHKIKPHWCGDCGFLIKYQVIVMFDE